MVKGSLLISERLWATQAKSTTICLEAAPSQPCPSIKSTRDRMRLLFAVCDILHYVHLPLFAMTTSVLLSIMFLDQQHPIRLYGENAVE